MRRASCVTARRTLRPAVALSSPRPALPTSGARMYLYDVRTIRLHDSDRSLADHLNRLARDGWRIVGVYARNTETGEVRVLVERPSDDR